MWPREVLTRVSEHHVSPMWSQYIPATVRTIAGNDKVATQKQCLVLTEQLLDLADDNKSHFMCFSEAEVASEVNTMVSTLVNVKFMHKFKKNVTLLNQGVDPIEATLH